MRGQHPGMPQPQSRQQSGYDDMQIWQQQMMFKQLQELQRQQQVRQSGDELRQQSLMNQLSAMTKQTAACPLPAVVNGMPLHDASNFTWQGEYAGNDLKVMNSPQMLLPGNLNSAQRTGYSMHELSNGLPLPQDQVHALQPFGFVSQQHDQSLYGLPVTGTRGWTNHYSHLHGITQPQDLSEATSKGGAMVSSPLCSNQSMYHQQNSQYAHIARRQDFPEKRVFGQPPADGFKNNISANFEQGNPLGRGSNVQEIHGHQEQSYSQGNYLEKTSQVPTPSSVSLDPTEQKILFSSDDDCNWDAFGMNSNMVAGSYLQGNSFDGNISYNSFPSFQGGSWSALMQSAVAEVSSNDSGLKEEWSGLSLQKTDVPGGNLSTAADTAKPHTNWFDNSLQGPPAALGPSSPFENGNANTRDKKLPTFLQSSAKFSSDQNVAGQDDAPDGSHQQSVQFRSPNTPNPLIQHHDLSSYLSDTKPGIKGEGYPSPNDIHPSSLKASFKVSDFSSSMQHGQMNDYSGTINGEKSHGNGSWHVDSNRALSSLHNPLDGMQTTKSGFSPAQMQSALAKSGSNKGLSIHGSNEHNPEHRKHMLLDSSQVNTGKLNLGSNSIVLNKRPHGWDSNPDNSDKVSGDTHGRDHPSGSQKELSNDSYISTHSHPDSSDSGGVARAGSDSHSRFRSNKKIHGQVGHGGSVPQKFQYHPMGNLGFVSEFNDPAKKSVFAIEQHQMPLGDSNKYQHPQQVSSSTMDMDRLCAKDAERSTLGSIQENMSNEFQMPSFCDGAAGASSQNKRNGQRSRNMLELINKVDKSTINDATKNYDDQILFPQKSEAGVSDGQISDPQYRSPPFQGIGLQLGPPYERSSISNSVMNFSPQVVAENSVKPHFPDGKEKADTWLNTPAPGQSLHHTGIPNSDGFDGQPTVSQKTCKEASESSTQSRYISSMHASQSYAQNQLQNQLTAGTSSCILNDQPSNSQYGVRANSITEDRHQHLNNTHTGNIINGSSQSSLSDMADGASPFRFALPQDIHSASAIPKSGSPNFGSNLRSSSLQMPESQVCPQSSLAQQAGFSRNFQLWSNFSAQRMSNNFLQKGMPSSLQSISPNNFRSPPWMSPKVDSQDQTKASNTTSTMGTCLVNGQNQTSEEERRGKQNFRQQFPPVKMDFSSLVQDSLGTKVSDGSLDTASQSTIKAEQKDSNNDRLVSSISHLKALQMQNHETHGFLFRPPDAQNRDYSLLQQVQSLSALEGDQHNRLGKRPKGMDCNMESQGLTGKMPHSTKMVDGYNTGGRVPPGDNELSAVVQSGSFPSNSRMLSFSSTVCEDQNASKIVQDHGTNLLCQDLSKLSNSLNSAQSIGVASPLSLVKGIENSQVASTWVEHPETCKDGYASPMTDDNESLQQNPESEHCLNSKISDWKNIDRSVLDHKLSAEVLDLDSVQRPKKRKSAELLPWHREISEGSHWLHSIRMAELDWANATNRLIEKGEDEADISDDGSSIIHSRRRLILTTALMQQLLPSVPVATLTQPALTAHESVMYLIAKLGLGDSCGMVSSLANGICISSTTENTKVGKFKDFEKSGDKHFLKIVENLIGRALKLEGDLQRIEKRASVLDIKVECQDLERFSIINRFAKFHGRSQSESVESSSTSEAGRRTYPQRFVTAITSPGNPPEGLICLSL